MLGCYDKDASYVQMLFYFLLLRLVLIMAIFCTDMFSLTVCESWKTPVQNKLHPNEFMWEFSSKSYCSRVRHWYTAFFVFDVLWSTYGVWMTWLLAEKMEVIEASIRRKNETVISEPSLWRFLAGGNALVKKNKKEEKDKKRGARQSTDYGATD